MKSQRISCNRIDRRYQSSQSPSRVINSKSPCELAQKSISACSLYTCYHTQHIQTAPTFATKIFNANAIPTQAQEYIKYIRYKASPSQYYVRA